MNGVHNPSKSISPVQVLCSQSLFAGDKRSLQTIIGQQYFSNCVARFFQNLSMLSGFPCCTNYLNILGMWLQIGRKGPGVECKVRAQINSTLIHDCTINIFRGADAAFLAACWEVGSREWAVMSRRTCNNICVFWKHVVSVVQVYTYCIKCKTFQFRLAVKNLAKWNESRAWSQVSVGRALVRYKWLHSL